MHLRSGSGRAIATTSTRGFARGRTHCVIEWQECPGTEDLIEQQEWSAADGRIRLTQADRWQARCAET